MKTYGQKNIKVTFIVTDWNGNPISDATIYIETDDKRENALKGKYKFNRTIFIDKKKNETIETFKLPAIQFVGRSVTIEVFGPLFEYCKIHKQENITLRDGQTFNIQLERDWDAYHSRTNTVHVVGYYQDSLVDMKYLKGFLNKSYKLKVLTDDFERTNSDYAVIVFNVDTNCTLTNRNIVKNISGMKTDLPNDFLDAVQKELTNSKTECVPMDSVAIRINWRIK